CDASLSVNAFPPLGLSSNVSSRHLDGLLSRRHEEPSVPPPRSISSPLPHPRGGEPSSAKSARGRVGSSACASWECCLRSTPAFPVGRSFAPDLRDRHLGLSGLRQSVALGGNDRQARRD